MKIEVSNGEIVDKLTILQIKKERIEDSQKLQNITKEYEYLYNVVNTFLDVDNDPLYKNLYEINCRFWDIQDMCRKLEAEKEFGSKFIETVRSVYVTNEERSVVKKEINLATGSKFVEEKSYKEFK
jgi:hypothetical protein